MPRAIIYPHKVDALRLGERRAEEPVFGARTPTGETAETADTYLERVAKHVPVEVLPAYLLISSFDLSQVARWVFFVALLHVPWLRSLTPELIGEMRAEMAADGVGEPAIRKTLVLLQSILERAVEWRRLDSNPARAVRKPSQRRTHVVRPLPPQTVEAMRAHLLAKGKQLDATLVAVLAYAGLRPGEAIGLRWHDVREHTILVERSVAFGQLKPTKTGQTRTVRLLRPLAATLAAWREATPRSTPTDLVFPAPDGSPWSRERTLNWRKRAFAEAAAAAGVPTARPYDLRHSCISLLIAQGATVVEVARQAGHSPTMALSTYAHLFDEFAEAPRTSAEEIIRAARATASTQEVSVLCPRPVDPQAHGPQNPCKPPVGDPGLEPGTSSLSEKRSNRLS
jgi:integrase